MDRLTLYFFPSPFGLSWNTPHSINRTSLVNSLAELYLGVKHCIGHVNIELDFPSQGRRLMTGMTARDLGESEFLIRREGYGMGVLFHAFQGRLEETDEIEAQLESRYRSGKISFLELAVTTSMAKKLLAYYDEFSARKAELKYGFPVSPARFEGGGCSEYGAYFLELAGLMDHEFRTHWTRQVRVPSRLVGGPKTGARVSLAELLFHKRGQKWAEEHEDHFPLEFWDPEAMHFWLKRKWKEESLLKVENQTYEPVLRGRAMGLCKAVV